MSADHILVEDAGGIRTITLNRPERKNALTEEMRQRFCGLLSAAERDSAVRALIVTATDPVFTAGVDFNEVARQAPSAGTYDAQFAVNPGSALRAMSKPVIAAVNGACVSGGLEIALSCAFIVASERARFADTHARLGVVAMWGLTALLPRAVGIRKAREMSVTGNFVAADDALRIGLVNHVVAHDDLGPFTRALAGQIPDLPSVSETLLLYARGHSVSLADALALEAQHTARRGFDAAAFGERGRDTAARHKTVPGKPRK
ncbi:MAG: Enoyl-CoA hydratase/isomerase [Deltaproteobacteria bacterium]|nr:Enoyl-CoA hydratase/isomerase [Deltaproteobacteria bacterium]